VSLNLAERITSPKTINTEAGQVYLKFKTFADIFMDLSKQNEKFKDNVSAQIFVKAG
jgi:hypothetical protein